MLNPERNSPCDTKKPSRLLTEGSTTTSPFTIKITFFPPDKLMSPFKFRFALTKIKVGFPLKAEILPNVKSEDEPKSFPWAALG